MTAEFPAEPPTSGLFEAAEPESITPQDGDFLSSLILISHDAEGSDSTQG